MAMTYSIPPYLTPEIQNVLMDIGDERVRQDSKWGPQNHPDGTGGPGTKEAADIARAECEHAFGQKRGAWADILREEFFEALAESDPVALRQELVQVAAVCGNWIEAIDRRIVK